MASDKQVAYIMHLLAKAGYDTRWMNASFKALGAKMKDRSGLVEEWVRGLTLAEASALINKLKA